MAFSLQAQVVFPVDRPPIEHGVVTIEGERIVAVGQRAECAACIDLGRVALLPGLVNTHTHLEFSYLQQPLGEAGMQLADWIRLVIAERRRNDIALTISIITGLQESLYQGVTTLCDIATGLAPIDLQFDLDVTVALEVIGFSRARAASSLSAVIERLNSVQGAEGGWSALARHGLRLGISPHAPYTVSPDLLRELVSLATIRGLPMAMHLAECGDELAFLESGVGLFQELLEERSMWDAEAVPRGSRPLDYLSMLAEAPRALVIHGNYLDDSELAFLGSNRERMSLVYCPRTHEFFRHAQYPLTKALEAGVRVVLGTDSRASNPDLNLLAELHHVARTNPAIDPHDVLRMGTLSGAEALGREAEVGSITPGKLANLVAIPLPDHPSAKPGDWLVPILALDEQPSAVWLRGQSIDSAR